MGDFFQSIFGFLQYMTDFLVMTIGTIIRGYRLVYESYTMISGVYGSLPPIIVLSLTICVAAAIIKFILGRMTS